MDIHRISGQTLLDLPFFEGHALRLPCGKSNFLTNSTLFWLPVHGQGVGVLLVLRFQRDVVCRHLEGNSCLGGVHISGQTSHFPTGEGVTVLLRCSNHDVLIKDTRFVHAVHGQGVGVLLVLRFQRDVICGHLEGDGRLGGVHISGQTVHLPTGEGIAVLFGCGDAHLFTLSVLLNLFAHGHSVLLGDDLGVLRFQRDVVCRHLEGDGRLGGVHISGQTGHLPTGEGIAVLFGCGDAHLFTLSVLLNLFAHGHSVLLGDDLGVLRFQRDVVCRHLEGDGRLGGVHISGQTSHFPTGEGVTVLLGCGGNELCTHRHSRQVGNIAAVLQGDLCIGDTDFIGLGHSIGAYLIGLVVHIVFKIVSIFRHLDVHIVAAGGGGNRFALLGTVQQGHLRVSIVIIFAGVGHRVLGGIVGKVLSLGRVAERLLTQLNRTGLVLSAFLCNDGSTITTIQIGLPIDKNRTLVYTGNALKLNCEFANALCLRADQRIGAIIVVDGLKVRYFKALKGQLFSYGVAIRQLVTAAVVVIVILHSKPDVVGACLGGHRFRSRRQVICSAVLKGSLRDCVAIILLAGIGCRTGVEVKAEVPYRRPIFEHNRFFYNQNAAGRVPLALRGLDVYLIAAVLGLGREVVKLCVVVGAHTDEAQLAHALLIAGNDRVLYSPLKLKVALLQGREGQLSGGGHVHHNRLAVILGGDIQRAVNGRGALVVIAGFRAVDVRDCIAEEDLCLDITDKVNRVCCCGIVVEAFHSAVRHHQFALLLTGGKVFAFNIAAAYRIGNSGLAVITRQAAKDHGIPDDRFLRGIVRQLDIVEHAAGDLAVLVQLDLSDE